MVVNSMSANIIRFSFIIPSTFPRNATQNKAKATQSKEREKSKAQQKIEWAYQVTNLYR